MKLVLDFDGVLFDTAYEAYLIAINTYQKLYNNINVEYDVFLQYRYLVSVPWHYKYILDYCCKNQNINIQAVSELIENAKSKHYELFGKVFLEERKKLQSTSKNDWLKLNKPFVFTKELLNLGLNWDNVFIVSTKGKQTILDILHVYDELKIPADNIFGYDDYMKYKTKLSVIENNILKNDSCIFIDDLSKHLLDCKYNSNIKTLLPDWGYIESNNKEAVSQNIAIEYIKKCKV